MTGVVSLGCLNIFLFVFVLILDDKSFAVLFVRIRKQNHRITSFVADVALGRVSIRLKLIEQRVHRLHFPASVEWTLTGSAT
jgi:hypothetical protein